MEKGKVILIVPSGDSGIGTALAMAIASHRMDKGIVCVSADDYLKEEFSELNKNGFPAKPNPFEIKEISRCEYEKPQTGQQLRRERRKSERKNKKR